jgi:hypothetical protein
MLCAFFNVAGSNAAAGAGGGCAGAAAAAAGGGAGPKFRVRGRSKKAGAAAAKSEPAAVRPSESSTTVMHAQFEALPGERNVPKAYEADEVYELSDDDALPDDEQWDYVRQDADKEETFDDDAAESDLAEDDMSLVSDSSELSTSFDDAKSMAAAGAGAGVLLRKRSKMAAADQKAVYAGPQLCLEDDDFLD